MGAIGSLRVAAVAATAGAAASFTTDTEALPLALCVAVSATLVGGFPGFVGAAIGTVAGALAAGMPAGSALVAAVATAAPGAAGGALLRRGNEGPYSTVDLARAAAITVGVAVLSASAWAAWLRLVGGGAPVLVQALRWLPASLVAAGIPAAVSTCARGREGPAEGRVSGVLGTFLDNMPALVFLKDAGGRYRVVNRSFETFVGRPREEVLGRTDLELFPADVAGRFQADDSLVRGSGAPMTFEQEFAGKDGKHELIVTKFLVHRPPRLRHAVGGVVSDITEIRALGRAAEESAARLRRALSLLEATLEASGEGIVTVDRDRRIGHCNRRYVDMLDLPEEVLTTRDHGFAVLHARGRVVDPEGYVRRVEAIYAQPAEESFDVLRFRDGRIIERVSRPQVLDGEIVGRVWSFRDVTAFRRAEEALRGANETLQAIIEASPAAILALDRQGRVRSWNAAAEQIFGWSEAEVVGRIPPLVAENGEQAALQSIAEILERGAVVEREVTRRRKDGSSVVVQVRTSPLRGASPDGIALVSVLIDVTARRQAEEELRRHRDDLAGLVAERTRALEAANRELEAFTYTVSHDLRAPLRAISGFSSLLAEADADRLDATGRQALARITGAAQRMTRLIDDLLEHSQVARRPFRPERVDLAAVAESVLTELRAAEPTRKVEVTVERGLWAEGDPVLLRSVLQNLLGNAWKFSALREVAHIEIGATVQGGERVYYVRDDGAGFDMSQASRLFLPFERLHAGSQFEGTGIGLATVRRIVERHGGRLWAEGAVDRGATFYFTLGPGEGATARTLEAAYER